jgi:hypothetical protein
VKLFRKPRPFQRTNSISIDFRPLAKRLDELTDDDEQEIAKAIADEPEHVSDSASSKMAGILQSDLLSLAKEQAKFRRGFEKRLRDIWDIPLAMYEVIHALCTELGAELNSSYRPQAAKQQDFTFEALTRLHGRACLTGSEVGALLRSGHATGANARWRTLHELAVVGMFISERGQDVAKRYLDHDFIERARGTLQLEKYAERLGEEPVAPEEVERASRIIQELVGRYGTGYDSNYGWAAAALKNPNPNFANISTAIDMRHWAPYFRLASGGIHAGPHGSFFDLGLHPSIEAIPAGPSHFGLADPGGNSLISLHQITIVLMVHCLNMSIESNTEHSDELFREQVLTMIKMKMLQGLVNTADEVFVKEHHRQEAGDAFLGDAPRILNIS